jgi:hypothetical protein
MSVPVGFHREEEPALEIGLSVKYTCLYGAFCPETGERFSMILPYATGECMDIFLKEFSEKNFRKISPVTGLLWEWTTLRVTLKR